MIADRVAGLAAQSTWDALPIYIRQSDSLAIFKSRLKTALFTTAFDSYAHDTLAGHSRE